MYRQLYFGPYMRVWMPEIIASNDIQTCVNEKCEKHGEYLHTKFCPYCGSEVKNVTLQKPSQLGLHEFLEKELNDEDMFTAVYPDNVGFIIVVSNRRSSQGGKFLDDDGVETEFVILSDSPMDMSDFEKEDWKKFANALGKKKIAFEKKIGVLQWYS